MPPTRSTPSSSSSSRGRDDGRRQPEAMISGLDPVRVLGYGFLSLWPLYAIVLFARWLKRRAALRRFADDHQFRFRGVLPSDKYAPYTAFQRVRSSVLLYMVMEGRWNDFDVALFEYNRRRGVSYVGVIVPLPNDGTCFEIVARARPPARGTRDSLEDAGLASWFVMSEPIPGSAAAAIGPRTAALLRDGPLLSLETNLGYLFLTPMQRVSPDRVPDYLDYATSVARALGADAQSRRRDARVQTSSERF
jgi:hypothetical protein